MSIEKRIEDMKDELVASVQEICRIKSVSDTPAPGKPFGEGVAKSLDCALELSEKLGFKTANLDGFAGYAEYGEGEEYVAILGHLDVVPEGEGWEHPAYAAEIHDGKIYARGAMDDKGPTLAALYGLKAVIDEGLKLSKKVRVIFGTCEETASSDLEYYLSKEEQPIAGFTPDAEFPVIHAEKGLTTFKLVQDLKAKSTGIVLKSLCGGTRSNVVPDSCTAKVVCSNQDELISNIAEFSKTSGYDISGEKTGSEVTITSNGLSAHGSTPQLGKNAISQMFAFLGTLDFGDSDIQSFIKFYNDYIGMDCYGEKFGIALEDEVSGRLSFNMGIANVDEDKAELVINARYPVTFKLEDMETPLKKRLEGTPVRLENFHGGKPLYFPKDHVLVKKLMNVYKECTGRDDQPIAIGGGTYAKGMKNIVAYGPCFPGEEEVIHQPNEFVTIDNLVAAAKIYGRAIYELAK